MYIAELERVKRVKTWDFFFPFFFCDLDAPTGWSPPVAILLWDAHILWRSLVSRRHLSPSLSSLVSGSDLFPFTLVFQGAVLPGFVVAGARDCWRNNSYSLKAHVQLLSRVFQFCFPPSWRSVPVKRQLPGLCRTSVGCCDQ